MSGQFSATVEMCVEPLRWRHGRELTIEQGELGLEQFELAIRKRVSSNKKWFGLMRYEGKQKFKHSYVESVPWALLCTVLMRDLGI